MKRCVRHELVRAATLVAVASLWLAGCAHRPHTSLQPPVLHGSEGIAPVPRMDVLEVSPEMLAFLERYILPYEHLDTRLQLLSLAVTDMANLGFRYDDARTLTAAEAFRIRGGNCLSFANLMVALAREAGLEATFQEVSVQPEWTAHEDTILQAKHINVVLVGRHLRYVVDVTGRGLSVRDSQRRLSDREAEALFYSNLGVDGLLAGDLASAWAHVARAIETAPKLSDPWVNMGVVLSRAGQVADAIAAHRAALARDSGELAALSNLHDLYLGSGELEKAAQVQRKVERYRLNNPYYLLMLSNEAFEEGRFEESARLLQRAIERKEDDHQLHFALARARYLGGDRMRALSAWERARELAPASEQSVYRQPLDEIFAVPERSGR
ncbi:MAG: hypothetical protein R3348_00770 [Xanthomonadales bacterium]|nr:hypothetical protein [Xanthomonadales bacterium]